MSDLLFQNFMPVQSNLQPAPVTIASTTTIAPTTALSFITGTTNITTVTPPVTGYHELTFIFTTSSPGDFLTTGNIISATTNIVQYAPVKLLFNPINQKYYAGVLTL